MNLLLAKYLIYFFIGAGIIAIVQKMILIYQQYQHLSHENLEGFWDGSLRKYDKKEYDRVIAHLGICEKCQKKLHTFKSKKTNIEDHLIDDLDNKS